MNQILPTIHWHGLDQIRREKTEKNDKIETSNTEKTSNNKPDNSHSSTLPFSPPSGTHSPSNATHLREALWHFVREVSKVEEEMEFVTAKLKKERGGEESGLAYPWRDMDSSLDAMVLPPLPLPLSYISLPLSLFSPPPPLSLPSLLFSYPCRNT